MAETNPVGRPTKYDPSICQKMIDFFDRAHLLEHEEKVERKDGSTRIRTIYSANQLPTFERFAVENDVHVDTLIEWARVHKEFSEAYKKAKQIQKDFLIDLAIRGFYNPTFTIFTAKNITDMRDVVITKTEDNDFSDFDFSQLSADELEKLRGIFAKASPKKSE